MQPSVDNRWSTLPEKGTSSPSPSQKQLAMRGCADLHRHSGLRRPIGADAFEIRELKVKTGFAVANTELARVTRNNPRLPLFVQQSLAEIICFWVIHSSLPFNSLAIMAFIASNRAFSNAPVFSSCCRSSSRYRLKESFSKRRIICAKVMSYAFAACRASSLISLPRLKVKFTFICSPF